MEENYVDCVRPKDNERAEVWVRSFDLPEQDAGSRSLTWSITSSVVGENILRGVARCIASGRDEVVRWLRVFEQSGV